MTRYETEALLHVRGQRGLREAWLPVTVLGRVRESRFRVQASPELEHGARQRLVRVHVHGEDMPRKIEASRLREAPT